MMMRTTSRLAAALAVLACPTAASAQAQGDFPATILCDQVAFAAGPARDSLRVIVGGGKASYARNLPGGGTESGSGPLSGRALVLIGAGRGPGYSYTARYSGEVTGRGGLLTGRQTWTRGGKSESRACQLTLGDGKG